MHLTKDQILAAQDLPHRDIEVPEWGGTVRIRTMTGGERDLFEASVYDTSGDGVKVNRDNFRAKLLSKVLVDDKGNRLFSDKEIAQLGGKSSRVINRLFDVAQELNGTSKDVEDDIKKK